MRFVHPDRPGRAVRLAYGLNLHPGSTLDEVLEGMRSITLPLARRLGAEAGFGVGAYLCASVASELAAADDGVGRGRYLRFLREQRLDAFTFNAFPAEGFHGAGLKRRVFQPTWKEPARLRFTLDVARIAALAQGEGGHEGSHVSISTHPGLFGAEVGGEGDLQACADNLAQAAAELARIEERTGCRIVLALEPEPRASANDTLDLERFHALVRERGPRVLGAASPAVLDRHLGTCLDACHAAVEFEDPAEALERATAGGAPLGKLQFSSALSLRDPARNGAGRGRLLALDEPVYLHQVTGRGPDGLVRATDLPEVAQRWGRGEAAWRAATEWRCHFHVPVDLGDLAALGLATTRAFADELLARVLADPDRWGSPELHVEIETYTWNVLPREASGPGERIDGLEREYRHVLARLESAGWRRP